MISRAALLSLGLATLPAAAFAATPAAAPVETLNAGLTQAEKNGGKPFQARFDALAPVVDQAFDLPAILKTIVGVKYGQLSEADRTALLAAFRSFTVANYVANFDSDSGDHFTILPETRTVGADTIVETEIVPKEGDHVRIDYQVRQTGGAYRIVDVLQQGTISQAAVQRSDFRAALAEGGAQALISNLNKKVADMAGGAKAP